MRQRRAVRSLCVVLVHSLLWPSTTHPQAAGPPDVRYAQRVPTPTDPTGGMRELTLPERQLLERTTRWTPSRATLTFKGVAESSLVDAMGQELAKVTVQWVGLERNPLPKTGGDLARWRLRRSLSAFQLGKFIGIAEKDVRAAEASGREPLPGTLVEAMRRVYEGAHALAYQVWVENHSNCALDVTADIIDPIDTSSRVHWRGVGLSPSPGGATGPTRLGMEAAEDFPLGPNGKVPTELILDMTPHLSTFPLRSCRVKAERKREERKAQQPTPGGGNGMWGMLLGAAAAGGYIYYDQRRNQSCEFDVEALTNQLVAAGGPTRPTRRSANTVCGTVGTGCTSCSQFECNLLTGWAEGPRGRVTCGTWSTFAQSQVPFDFTNCYRSAGCF